VSDTAHLHDALERALSGGPERHHAKAAQQGKLPVRERVARLLESGGKARGPRADVRDADRDTPAKLRLDAPQGLEQPLSPAGRHAEERPHRVVAPVEERAGGDAPQRPFETVVGRTRGDHEIGLVQVAAEPCGAPFEVARQDLASQAWLAWLPIGLRHGILVEHHQSGHSGPNGRGKIGRREFLQLELDHRVLGDLAPFCGPVLQPVKPVLHLGNPAFEPRGHGLVA